MDNKKLKPILGDALAPNTGGIFESMHPNLIYLMQHRDGLSYWTRDGGTSDASFARASDKTYLSPRNNILLTASESEPTISKYGQDFQGTAKNLITYSTPDSSRWTRGGDVTVAGTMTYGDMTLWNFVGGSSATNCYIRPSADITVTTNTDYVFSFYAKNNDEASTIVARLYNVTGSTFFDSYSYGDETYGDVTRVEIPFTTPSSCTTLRVYFSYLSTNYDIYLGGAQLETGAVATAYTPTNGATATTTTEASDIYGKGLQVPMTQAMIDCFQGELIDWSEDWNFSSDPSDLEMVVDTDAHTLTSPGGTFSYITAGKSGLLTVGDTYEVSLTISNRTRGFARVQMISGFTGDALTTNETHIVRGVPASGVGNFNIQMFNSFDGTVTINYCRRVLDDGTTNPGAGTLIQWVYLPWDRDDVPNDTYLNVLTSTNSRYSGIYFRKDTSGNWNFRLTDTTNTVYGFMPATTPALYAFLAQWSADESKMRCGYYDPTTDSITWASWVTYRGNFPIYDNTLRYFYEGTLPISLGATALYTSSDLSDDTIINEINKYRGNW